MATTKLFKTALDAVDSASFKNPTTRSRAIRNALGKKIPAALLNTVTTSASIINGLSRSPEQVRLFASMQTTAEKGKSGSVSVTVTFNNDSKIASLETRILNGMGKVSFLPSRSVTFKTTSADVLLFDVFDAIKEVFVGVVTLKDQGTLKSNPLVHRAGTALSSSVAVAGSSALLPPLSKWEKTSVGYELDINGASFSVWKSGNSGKFRVAASRIHKAFPKLAKQFPHSYVALCRGELLNERTPDADVFKTPTEALKAFTAKLKLALIRNTNAVATASYVAVAESDELSDRVASIVYGDLKRIKSTIAAWKGKMTPEQYEEFEAYQNSVAKFIATTYVKRMSKVYQAKTNSI